MTPGGQGPGAGRAVAARGHGGGAPQSEGQGRFGYWEQGARCRPVLKTEELEAHVRPILRNLADV